MLAEVLDQIADQFRPLTDGDALGARRNTGRITLLLEKGVSPWDVAGATATSLRTIEKVYGKHVKNKLTAAVNAV